MKRNLIIIFTALALTVSCKEKVFTDIDVSYNQEENTETGSLKIVSYNILEGMKLDAENGYSNFVEWVKAQNPDILALEEANGFNIEKLTPLAEQWGHKYVATNCEYPGASTYPVALTSRYEMKDLRHIVDNVYHGGIHATIEGVEVTVIHLYPFGDIRDNVDWDKHSDIDSDGDIDGDDYRLHEANVYMEETILKEPSKPNWLLMGDFNSVSPLDKEHHTSNFSYAVNERVLEVYTDMLKEMHNEYCHTTPTVYGGWNDSRTDGKRIDFIYGSKALSREILKADIIYDEFTDNYSDHYPVVLEIRTYGKTGEPQK